ncbi:hypothetical protein [Hymenobacter sp. B1770]|uniref:hypothetical protein n=1 Tax=Hymenobacter sp. B1770 TaxID=1718788 RepID=UPI003CEBA567
MADINIQRKKSAPSPWVLVLLAALAVAIAAYFFLRNDPADEPGQTAASGMETTPAGSPPPGAPTDDTRAATAVEAQEDDEQFTPASLAAHAATNPAAPSYAVTGLQQLTATLVALTDRDDLRDPAITEQRDNLTSATNRLGESTSSLRPGFVAAAGLIRTMQQKAYPELENQVNDLVSLAGQMSGRSTTAADQQQTKQFLTQAAEALSAMSEPAH